MPPLSLTESCEDVGRIRDRLVLSQAAEPQSLLERITNAAEALPLACCSAAPSWDAHDDFWFHAELEDDWLEIDASDAEWTTSCTNRAEGALEAAKGLPTNESQFAVLFVAGLMEWPPIERPHGFYPQVQSIVRKEMLSAISYADVTPLLPLAHRSLGLSMGLLINPRTPVGPLGELCQLEADDNAVLLSLDALRSSRAIGSLGDLPSWIVPIGDRTLSDDGRAIHDEDAEVSDSGPSLDFLRMFFFLLGDASRRDSGAEYWQWAGEEAWFEANHLILAEKRYEVWRSLLQARCGDIGATVNSSPSPPATFPDWWIRDFFAHAAVGPAPYLADLVDSDAEMRRLAEMAQWPLTDAILQGRAVSEPSPYRWSMESP